MTCVSTPRADFSSAALFAAALLLLPGPVRADGPAAVERPQQLNWAGIYVGVQAGGAWGKADVSDPYGPSIYGDDVSTPGGVAGGLIGINWQRGATVYGLEADANWANLDGTNTCLAYSGNFVSSNCLARTSAFGTLTGRLGWAHGQSLFYGKAGAAWLHSQMKMAAGNDYYGAFPGQFAPSTTTSESGVRWGWTAGAGVEQALSGNWSLRFEYDYLRFGNENLTTPVSNFVPAPDGTGFAVVPSRTAHVSQDMQVFKVGLNYKIGNHAGAIAHNELASHGNALPRRPAGLEVELGARYWMSDGKFQWDNHHSNGVIQSRLTYDGMEGHSGELFGRVDTPSSIFLKGNAGVGTLTSGKMYDEDWGQQEGSGPFLSYMNTVSNDDGRLSYATADIGYDVLRGPGYKFGLFAGYNYYYEFMDSHGCVQVGNPATFCLSPGDARLIGSQSATWNSFRLGVSGEAWLFNRWKLSGDVAYLPYVKMSGRDNHLLRDTTTFFDQRGTGQGVQFEGILSYAVTDQLNIGVGGRYWAMWTTDGHFTCTGCGDVGVTSPRDPARLSTERYGLLLQASYQLYGQRDLEPLK